MSDFWLGVTVGPTFGLGVALPFLAYRAWGWLKNEFYYHRAVREARRWDAAHKPSTREP